MIFNKLKTRKGRLKDKIIYELKQEEPNIDIILQHIEQYEKDNLETIDKLKRKRVLDAKRISGGLRQTINVHGPITKVLIGSATKRIIGALLDNTQKESFIKIILKWIKR
jgi:hypothetical protein